MRSTSLVIALLSLTSGCGYMAYFIRERHVPVEAIGCAWIRPSAATAS